MKTYAGPTRKILRRGFGLRRVLILLIVISLATLGVLVSRGLGNAGKDFIRNEFRQRGMELDFRKVTLDPLRGLVAHDVAIYEGPQRVQQVAFVNRIALDINIEAALRGRPFLESVDLRDATIRLPVLGSSGEEAQDIVMHGLNAEFRISPTQLRLSQATWNLLGVDISLRGTLVHHETLLRDGELDEDAEGDGSWYYQLVEQLQAIQYHGRPARLSIEFFADARALENVDLRLQFLAEQIEFQDFRIHDFRVLGQWHHGRLRLREFLIQDDVGTLAASGELDFGAGDWHIDYQSSIDLPSLLSAVSEGVFDAEMPSSFYEVLIAPAPTLQGQWSAEKNDLGEMQQTLIGSLSIPRLSFRHLSFNGLKVDFSWDGQQMFLRNLQVQEGEGRLRAHVMRNAEGILHLSMTSDLDPELLRPFLSGRGLEAFEEWEFFDRPELEMNLMGSLDEPEGMQLEGRLRLGHTGYRGVNMRSANARVRYADKAFVYDGFWIERDEGFASGTMTYDFGRRRVEFRNVVSTLNPSETAVWIDRNFPNDLRSFQFQGAPTLTVEGHVEFGGLTDHDMVIEVDAPEGMNYELLGKWLPLDEVRGRMHFTEGLLTLSNIEGRLYGGKLQAGVRVGMLGDTSYACDIAFQEIGFKDFNQLYFDYNDASGSLSGGLSLRGDLRDMRRLAGQGNIEVRDGSIFVIPYFGPLSGLLNEIIPGMGFSNASLALSDFTIRQGVLETDSFEVRGSGFTMIGGGKLDFPDDRIDFNVRVNARGMSGMILFPVSKLFEYTATSGLSDPQWRPKRFSTRSREDRAAAAENSRP
ncbi:MAG: AsmA-like C-terminal region-containing protein [Verrucomicrobiales bacterium]